MLSDLIWTWCFTSANELPGLCLDSYNCWTRLEQILDPQTGRTIRNQLCPRRMLCTSDLNSRFNLRTAYHPLKTPSARKCLFLARNSRIARKVSCLSSSSSVPSLPSRLAGKKSQGVSRFRAKRHGKKHCSVAPLCSVLELRDLAVRLHFKLSGFRLRLGAFCISSRQHQYHAEAQQLLCLNTGIFMFNPT